MTKQMILVRGPSGTGKSTISRFLKAEHDLKSENDNQLSAFHETDQFFTDAQGVYHFQLSKLQDAHRWNQLNVERSLLHGIPLVIVTNTFVAHWEMERYFEMAEEYDYEVNILRTPGPWDADVSFARNEHGVPLNVLKRHISCYQNHDKDVTWADMAIFDHE